MQADNFTLYTLLHKTIINEIYYLIMLVCSTSEQDRSYKFHTGYVLCAKASDRIPWPQRTESGETVSFHLTN